MPGVQKFINVLQFSTRGTRGFYEEIWKVVDEVEQSLATSGLPQDFSSLAYRRPRLGGLEGSPGAIRLFVSEAATTLHFLASIAPSFVREWKNLDEYFLKRAIDFANSWNATCGVF